MIVLLSSCGWPRWAHPPDDGAVAIEDLQPQFGIPWGSPVAEVEPNAVPANVGELAVSLGKGFVAAGALDGVGWSPGAAPRQVDGCDGPADYGASDGAYREDADTWVIAVDGPGWLCARSWFDPAAQPSDVPLFDLLLVPVDDCGGPLPPVNGDDGLLGYTLGPGYGGWGTSVVPGSYALLTAGVGFHTGGDPGATYPYSLAVALLPENPDGPTACPLVPGEPLEEEP